MLLCFYMHLYDLIFIKFLFDDNNNTIKSSKMKSLMIGKFYTLVRFPSEHEKLESIPSVRGMTFFYFRNHSIIDRFFYHKFYSNSDKLTLNVDSFFFSIAIGFVPSILYALLFQNFDVAKVFYFRIFPFPMKFVILCLIVLPPLKFSLISLAS